MSLSNSPRLVKGGLVVLDAATGAVVRTIALQYNPDTLTRSYQVQGVGGEGGGDRAQPFRLKGPAVQTIEPRVSIVIRVMSTDDLGFEHRGGSIFLNHLRAREALAGKTGSASLQTLGIGSLPP